MSWIITAIIFFASSVALGWVWYREGWNKGYLAGLASKEEIENKEDPEIEKD